MKTIWKAERTFRGNIDLVSWNIGFGAYEADYDFFMDGGKQSWAPSKERLAANMDRIAALMAAEDADVYLFQEVDTDGFLVSDNVEVRSDSVIDTAFAYSDHNPVRMRVTLKDQNRRESRNDSPGE